MLIVKKFSDPLFKYNFTNLIIIQEINNLTKYNLSITQDTLFFVLELVSLIYSQYNALTILIILDFIIFKIYEQ